MNLLNLLGLKKENKPETAQSNSATPENEKPEPHGNGGCCGSCGGQGHK